MRRIIVACLLLSGCQASPSLPPYLNAASECGGRSLAPAAYAECDYIVFVNNLIRANTQAGIEARRRRLAEWAAAALSDPPGYQPPFRWHAANASKLWARQRAETLLGGDHSRERNAERRLSAGARSG
jgi:hypothetical protein